MQPITIAIISACISGVSACIAATSLGWNVRNALAERGRIRFTVRVMHEYDPTSGVKSTEPLLHFTATNIGKRAVFLAASPFGGTCADGDNFINHDPCIGFPAALQAGEAFSFCRNRTLLAPDITSFHLLGAGDNAPRWIVNAESMQAIRETLTNNP